MEKETPKKSQYFAKDVKQCTGDDQVSNRTRKNGYRLFLSPDAIVFFNQESASLNSAMSSFPLSDMF